MAEGGLGYVLKTRMKVHLIRRYERPFSGNLTLAHLSHVIFRRSHLK
jgi:hypothetical protein